MSVIREFKTQKDYLEYSKNIQHGYSRGGGKLFDLVANYLPNTEEACRNGAKAIYTNEFCALCYAAGIIPVAHTELGRLADKNGITIAENHFLLPRDACSMLGSLMGEYYLRRNGPIKRILSTTSCCEVQSGMLELLKYEGYDVFKYDGGYKPAGCSKEKQEQLIQFIVHELETISEFLTGGERVPEEKMHQELVTANRIIKKLQRIMALRVKKPLYMKSLAAMYLVSGYEHFYGKPQEYEEMCDMLIEELEDDTIDYPHDGKCVPLIWNGARGQEFSIYNAIDDCGGAILAYTIADLTKEYRMDVPPLEAMAYYHFGDMTPMNAPQNVQEAVLKLAQSVGAKGVIQYEYVGCTMGGVNGELMREYLKDYGLTALSIEGTFQVGPPSGQIMTRVGAFMEMLS